MIIQPVSDLHFEFHRDGGDSVIRELDVKGVDVGILAGDIIPYAHHYCYDAVQRLMNRWPQTLFVGGNHEFYGMDFNRKWQLPMKLKVLTVDNPVTIDGQRFVGDTMWFREPGPDADKNSMNDFSQIKNFEPGCYVEAEKTIEYLRDTIQKDDVVVTHYLPSMKSVPKQYKSSPLNAFFVTDVEDIIMDKQPKLWIHGHTHTTCDYTLGKTRVICNPLGYPHENSGFDPALKIAI